MSIKKFFVCLIFLVSTPLTAEIPTYYLVATCFGCGYSGANAINFKIYLASRDTSYFEYSGGQYLLQVDTNIANGGTLTYEIFASELPTALRPVNPTVVRKGSNFILGLDRNEFPSPGNGFNLTRRGVFVVHMIIRTTAATIGSPIENNLTWINEGNRIYSTKIFAYVNMVNTEISNSQYHEMDFMFPVELAYFTSNVFENTIALNWSTTNELNNYGFDVERWNVKFNEPENWEKIFFAEGYGTTASINNYSFHDRDLNSGKYKYRLKQIDYNGNFEFFNLTDEVNVGTPAAYHLSQNYPNPFNPITKISYNLPKSSRTILKINDITGKEVATPVDEIQEAGYYSVNFNANNLSSGIYFYTLISDGLTLTKKMTVLK